MGYNKENIFTIPSTTVLNNSQQRQRLFHILKILKSFNLGIKIIFYTLPKNSGKNLKQYSRRHFQVVDKPVDNPSSCNSQLVLGRKIENGHHMKTNLHFTSQVAFSSLPNAFPHCSRKSLRPYVSPCPFKNYAMKYCVVCRFYCRSQQRHSANSTLSAIFVYIFRINFNCQYSLAIQPRF